MRGNVWTHFVAVARSQQELAYADGQREQEEDAGAGHREEDDEQDSFVEVLDETGLPIPF